MVDHAQQCDRQRSVENLCFLAPPSKTDRLADEKRTDIVRDAAQGIERHEQQRSRHQKGLLRPAQRLEEIASDREVVHVERERHQKTHKHEHDADRKLQRVHLFHAQRYLFEGFLHAILSLHSIFLFCKTYCTISNWLRTRCASASVRSVSTVIAGTPISSDTV